MKPNLMIVLMSLAMSPAFAEVNVKAEQLNPADPAGQSKTPVTEVIVIIKTHFDIGYTHRVKEIVHHYRTEMIDRAMNIMDQSKSLPLEQQFAWTGPGWVMSKVLEDWDGQLPAGAKFTAAKPVNLRGEKNGQPVAIADGNLTVTLPAYAPASIILQDN